MFSRIWSEEALTQKMTNLTAKQAEDLEKDAVKKEKKAEAKAEKEKKVLAVSTNISHLFTSHSEHPFFSL